MCRSACCRHLSFNSLSHFALLASPSLQIYKQKTKTAKLLCGKRLTFTVANCFVLWLAFSSSRVDSLQNIHVHLATCSSSYSERQLYSCQVVKTVQPVQAWAHLLHSVKYPLSVCLKQLLGCGRNFDCPKSASRLNAASLCVCSSVGAFIRHHNNVTFRLNLGDK